MENFLQKIDADLKEALKARDEIRTSAVRLIKSAVKYKAIEKAAPLVWEDILSVLSSQAKQRRESIEQYNSAGRPDLAEKEKKELEVLLAYLPSQLSEEELDKIIIDAIKESGAASASDMGKVMKIVAPKTKGSADGKIVNQRVKELLAAKV